MLKIRLKRTGRKGQPHYRIVVMESTKPRNSNAVAEVGYYNPRTSPSTIKLEKAEVEKWLKNGAQPSETVEQILVKEGILKQIKRGSKLAEPKPKKKAAAEA